MMVKDEFGLNLEGAFVESAFSREQVGDGAPVDGCAFLDLTTQAEFLRDAMTRLGMTRNQLAERIAVRRKTLDTWLLPPGSNADRVMPEMAWKFIREILENSSK